MINSDREGDQHVKVDAFACRCLLPDLMSQLGNNSQETKYLAYDSRCADNIVRVFVTHSRLSTASQSFCFPQPTCAARARLFSRQRHVLPPWHNLKIILPWLLPHSSFPLLPSGMIKLNPRDLPHSIASAIQSKRSETKKDLDLIVKIGIWLKYCRVSIAYTDKFQMFLRKGSDFSILDWRSEKVHQQPSFLNRRETSRPA